MGAASFVNFARIVLTIDPLSEKDAGRIGVPPWDVRSIFRVHGVKQNFSPADAGDRWFKQVSVELNNARPPIYPAGDKVAVVEPFQPGSAGPAYGAAVIAATLTALDTANPPLSPSKRATGRYAADAIARAIAPHRGGRVSDTEAAAVLDHIIRSGLAAVQRVKIARPGGRADERNGLVVTSLGKAALKPEPASSATPHSPQRSRGNNAGPQDGGGPKGPRNVPRGCGGNAGHRLAGKKIENLPLKPPAQAPDSISPAGASLPPGPSCDSPAASVTATTGIPAPEAANAITSAAATTESVVTSVENHTAGASLVPDTATPLPAASATPSSAQPVDDLDIPPPLRRPKSGYPRGNRRSDYQKE